MTAAGAALSAVVATTEGGDVAVVGDDDMIAAELADTKLVEPTALPGLGRSL
jgi:hypothetical protein